MDYTYFAFPASEANLAKIPSVISAFPNAMAEYRATILVQNQTGMQLMAGVNCGSNMFWVLNLLESEITTFNSLGLIGVLTYETPQDLIKDFVQVFNRAS